MKNIYLKEINLEGIHKRYDLSIDFNENLTVLHGQNGTGKSTLIHIIANIANCDFIRFAFLEFKKIEVTYSDGTKVRVSQNEIDDDDKEIIIETQDGKVFKFSKIQAQEAVREAENERAYPSYIPELKKDIFNFSKLNELRKIETSYFPAFRTMLEAWSSSPEMRERRPFRSELTKKKATSFSRNLFGQFLPTINFPSPIDIEHRSK